VEHAARIFAQRRERTTRYFLTHIRKSTHNHGANRAPYLERVWAGIAADAVDRARKFIRHAGRQGKGSFRWRTSPCAGQRNIAINQGLVSSALQIMTLSGDDRSWSFSFQTTMSLLKVNASELAISTVMTCVQDVVYPAIEMTLNTV